MSVVRNFQITIGSLDTAVGEAGDEGAVVEEPGEAAQADTVAARRKATDAIFMFVSLILVKERFLSPNHRYAVKVWSW